MTLINKIIALGHGHATYGELLDLFSQFEGRPDLLFSQVSSRYPSISISRPSRLYDTVQRIVGPTKPSLHGPAKLTGSPLATYRKRIWKPRVRTTSGIQSMCAWVHKSDVLPLSIGHVTELPQGLCQEELDSLIEQLQIGSKPVYCDKLSTLPTIGFYKKLHAYLCNRNLPKVLIGRLYFTIDCNFQSESRPDNIYRFVENIVSSGRPLDSPMLYNLSVVKSTSSLLKKCHTEIEELDAECMALRKEVDAKRTAMKAVTRTLRDITNENQCTQRKYEISKAKVQKLKDRNKQLELDCVSLELENHDLMSGEESSDYDASFHEATDLESTFQDIVGRRRYSPRIRKLYYSLLADQVPVSKIAKIIQSVLKCFHPSLNVDELTLPKKSCASYMRMEEMKTICDSHKAHELGTNAAEKGIFLNTDGTTKQQRKLGGVVANGMVVSVNELVDGRADSAVDDISKQFERIREIARLLRLPNANCINWTLIKSSSSDSASTQKRLNKLIEEKREFDADKFGSDASACTVETLEFIRTFCSMHLGINLRKAFLDTEELSHNVDTLVYEFCKLFGRCGPEYACGVSFNDFLHLKISTTENAEYYQTCLKVHLQRQVGSRYFVTALNATKVLFLKDAAIDFLKFTGKDTRGNKLERDLFAKLNDPAEHAHLQVDGLMYYHVYGDMYMLSKSNDLGLSVLDMNNHYLELHDYLTILEATPELVFDPTYHVFLSEDRLYGSNPKLNHRLKSPAAVVYDKLFDKDNVDCAYLTGLVGRGALRMKCKLITYAQDQLPGGCFWEADEGVRAILSQIKPSNDACESIFGLNDYLTTAIPNMHQMARSNLVQTKKNATLKWLSDLPEEKQSEIVDLAIKQRKHVHKDCQDEEKMRCRQRQQRMVDENTKRVATDKRLQEEKEKLSQSHLITSSSELKAELESIDKEAISATRKKNKKIELLKTQVRMRKKLLCQTIPIVFTTNRKQLTTGRNCQGAL